MSVNNSFIYKAGSQTIKNFSRMISESSQLYNYPFKADRIVPDEIALKLNSLLIKKNNSKISLIGKLGSGKTTFVKNFLQQFYSINSVSSPSFSYCNAYAKNILHYDLYRVENQLKLEEIAIFEEIESNDSLVFIEWADKFPEVYNRCDIALKFQINPDNSRLIEIFELNTNKHKY